jgi:leader peptidase (prepilin peptidase) / N-methyltransferase
MRGLTSNSQMMSTLSAAIEVPRRNGVLVGLASLAVAAGAFAAHAPRAYAFVAAAMAPVLIVVSASDLERRIIPNKIVLPASALALAAQIAISPGHTGRFLLAGVAACAVFAIPSLINPALMGMGDAKLALLIGFGLGQRVVTALVISCLAVLPVAVFMMVKNGVRKATLPFGPFLALGALVVLIAPLLNGS